MSKKEPILIKQPVPKIPMSEGFAQAQDMNRYFTEVKPNTMSYWARRGAVKHYRFENTPGSRFFKIQEVLKYVMQHYPGRITDYGMEYLRQADKEGKAPAVLLPPKPHEKGYNNGEPGFNFPDVPETTAKNVLKTVEKTYDNTSMEMEPMRFSIHMELETEDPDVLLELREVFSKLASLKKRCTTPKITTEEDGQKH